MSTDVWRTCLVCGTAASAIRLHQMTNLKAESDGGAVYEFLEEAENGLNIWYYCDIRPDAGRDGCGAVYSVSYDRSGDRAEAQAAEIVAAMTEDWPA